MVTLPAGRYYIGDLCYVLGDRWDEFCSLTITGNNVLDGKFTLKDGTECVFFRTMWGDGEYTDLDGNRYPVDAGLIGAVKVEYLKNHDLEYGLDFGSVLDFYSDFNCYCDENGVIHFGAVAIDTDPEFEDEDYEDA